MASIAVPMRGEQAGPLRALNILRDLPQVADLIELCFETTMDDDGHSYVQQMRRASADRDFLAWANKVMETTSMPLAGYVWEENGKIIGNASLVFQAHKGRKLAMIANVATHPDFRGRGIGRALTERALLGASQKGTGEVWLQVRHDNPAAIHIYAELGFEERARRTTYQSRLSGDNGASDSQPVELPAKPRQPFVIGHRLPYRHWAQQRNWLERAHPEELGWYARWDWNRLGPGLTNSIYRLLVQFDVKQWAATDDQELLATAALVPTYRVSNMLWLGAGPTSGAAVTRVLEAARGELKQFRKLTVEYPEGELKTEIEAAGFASFRTLLWMRATRSDHPRTHEKKET